MARVHLVRSPDRKVEAMQPTDFVTGLHHVTVCVGGAQEDIDFNAGVMVCG